MGRGSAVVAIAMIVCLLLPRYMVDAATFTVGDGNGWTFNVDTWPTGKTFKAGDTLVFNYNPSLHNVVAVDKAGYEACDAPEGSKVYESGKDQIKLRKGDNYFICNFEPEHCGAGMNLAVTAH